MTVSSPQATMMSSVFWKSLIAATCAGHMLFLSYAFLVSAQEFRDAKAKNERLIQRLDTDSLITELALAKLEGREPSLRAQKYWETRTTANK